MNNVRSREQYIFEVMLVFVVMGITSLFCLAPTYRSVILDMYFLPVALSGFYLGRYRAGGMALFSIMCVTIVTILDHHYSAAGNSPVFAVASTSLWAAVLCLTALLIGNESDDRNRKLSQLRETHKTDTLLDELTGVANRRAFDYELSRRIAEWNRQQTPVALVLIDIDHFKRFNDTFGHPIGDAVLRDVARKLKETMREVDLLARYGGEEFGIVLPHTSLGDAKEAAERARTVIESHRFEVDGLRLRLTVSAGVAHVMAGEDAMSLVRRSDMALYSSKRAGRNCAHLHSGRSCEHFGASLPSLPVQENGDIDTFAKGIDAYTDRETGLPSRKVFNEELRRRVSEAHRYDSRLTVMLLEINGFKESGFQGPQASGTVVAIAAEFVCAAVRDSDLVARYATNQFAVLLPTTSLCSACIPAERIRRLVSDYKAAGDDLHDRCLTVSVGLAELRSDEDAVSVVERGESAMTAATAGGGNCVYLHKEDKCEPAASWSVLYQ